MALDRGEEVNRMRNNIASLDTAALSDDLTDPDAPG